MEILLLVIIALLLFLLFLGVYGDIARRTGFPITSGVGFLLAPIIYALTIIGVFLPVVYFVFYPLFFMDLSSIARLLIPLGLAAFGLLVIIGALPLWFLHHKTSSFKQCILLSTRLMLSPIIDAFWASVAVFVGTLLAIPALFISSLITLFQISQFGSDVIGIIGYVLSPSFSLPFIIVFMVFGLLSAYYIFKRGPSEVLSKYFYFMGTGVLILSVLVGVVLFLYLGIFSFIISGALFVIGLVIFIFLRIISFLFGTLRIAGVFGLSITVLSVLFLILVFGGAEFLSSIPLVGSIVLEFIPPVLWTVALEIGVVGFVAGIIIIVLALRTEETGQVMTRAMAISVGASSFMPLFATAILQFLNLGFLSGLLGTAAGVFLAFSLMLPIYLISVCLLRLGLAFKLIVKPSGQKTATPTEPKFKPH